MQNGMKYFLSIIKTNAKNVTQCELFQMYIIMSTTVKISIRNRPFAFSKLLCGLEICNIEFANCKVCFGKIGPIDLSPNSSSQAVYEAV